MASRRDELGRAIGRHLQALAERRPARACSATASPRTPGRPGHHGQGPGHRPARRHRRGPRLPGSVREAEQARKLAETELGKARQALDDCDQACRQRSRGWPPSRADVAGQLRGWAGRWAGDQPSAILDAAQADALAAALGRIGEPDAATLTETFTALTQPRADTLISRREQLASRAASLAEEQRSARRNGERSPASTTTRPPPLTCGPPTAPDVPAPRSGSWSGSRTGCPTRPPPGSRARCTGQAC